MASHEGVASRWELEALGLGRDAITKRARSGRLHRVHQGVYALHSSLTSLARTLLDVAEVVPHRILIAAIDRAEELRILDLNAQVTHEATWVAGILRRALTREARA